MRSRRRGRAPLAGIGLAATVLLVGCAGIPSSGPVREAGQVAGVGDEPFTRILAAPPADGAPPEAIVSGFLTASASFDDDHAVAREFLTNDAARAWTAGPRVAVYVADTAQIPPPPKTTGASSATVHFTAAQAGLVSEQGAYSGLPDRTFVDEDFGLRRVGGQWRIATLPSELLLTTNDLSRAFRSYDIYFPNPARSVVVPDQILVPVGPGASTSLVRALLAGPTPWLSPAVRTAIPAGTKLVVDSVPVRDGVVQVDLTAPAANIARAEAQAMSAQFVWTLRQIAGITTVRITVDGVPLRVPGVGDAQSINAWSEFDPDGGTANSDAYAVTDKSRAVVFTQDKLQPVRGPFGDGSTLLAQVVPSFDGTELAAIDKDRRRLLVSTLKADAKAQVLVEGTSLSAPTWDRFGDVLVVDRARGTATVWEAAAGSPAKKVTLEDLPAGNLTMLRLARDGVRVAALMTDSAGVGHLYLGRVERSDTKLALAGFRLVNTDVGTALDFAWFSADRLVVLAAAHVGDVPQAWLVDLNGQVELGYGPPAGDSPMVSVAAAPTQPVLASTEDGSLQWYTGIGWDGTPGKGAYPAYPG